MKYGVVCGLIIAMVGTASVGLAGKKDGFGAPNVIADGASRYATGFIGAARAAPGTSEFIGCEVDTTATGSNVICQAGDSSGNTIYTFLNNAPAALVQSVASIHPDSQIYVQWDVYGQITSLYVYNGSVGTPKAS